MANATADLEIQSWGADEPVEMTMLVAASSKIYKGTMVMKVGAGGGALYAARADDAVGAGSKVIGICKETVDNTAGANGDKSVTIIRQGAFRMTMAANPARDPNEMYVDVYVLDDNSVTRTAPANSTIAGRCVKVDSATACWIEFKIHG